MLSDRKQRQWKEDSASIQLRHLLRRRTSAPQQLIRAQPTIPTFPLSPVKPSVVNGPSQRMRVLWDPSRHRYVDRCSIGSAVDLLHVSIAWPCDIDMLQYPIARCKAPRCLPTERETRLVRRWGIQSTRQKFKNDGMRRRSLEVG